MNTITAAGLGLGLTMQMCSTDPYYDNTPTSTGFSCWDYETMLEVEAEIASECTTDSDCDQVIDGTGCGCATDDLIANSSYDLTSFYDLYDEALGESCSIDFGTSCDCNPSATPVCAAGQCAWQ